MTALDDKCVCGHIRGNHAGTLLSDEFKHPRGSCSFVACACGAFCQLREARLLGPDSAFQQAQAAVMNAATRGAAKEILPTHYGETKDTNQPRLKPTNPDPGLGGDAAARKAAPIASGVLFYFPNALAAVAGLSKAGNEQHNPGQPMHWAFDKSSDEADCIARHLAQSGTVDKDGVLHSAKVAWRALALLERELLASCPGLEPGKNVRNFKR